MSPTADSPVSAQGDAGRNWSTARIAVAESLWGEGFVSPGGRDETLRLAAPLGLTASSSLLLLGAGLGGAAHHLTDEFDCWVTGHEADPALADLAAGRLKREGGEIARRASVAAWNLDAPMFKKRGFHHALSLDVAGSRSAAPVLRAAAQALKPNGQLVFVQLVSTTPLDPGDAAIGAWVRVERRDGLVPSEACITQTLAEMRFDVRVVEDVTERHRRSVMRGWAALVRVLGAPKPTPTAAAAIVREAELWMRRERLMQTGQLRLMRWHAIGPG